MNSIKTGFVVIVMLAVAYGVWVILNKQPVTPPVGMNQQSWNPPRLDLDEAGQFGPQMHTPDAEQPGAPGPATTLPPNFPSAGNPPPPVNVTGQPESGDVQSPYPGAGGNHAADAGSPSRPSGAPVVGSDQMAAASPRGSSFGDGRADHNHAGHDHQHQREAAGQSGSSSRSVYGEAAARDGGATPDSESAREFAIAWRGVQDQLSKGELSDALFTLSLWYGSRDVPEEMRPQLVELLDQLAGAVIYSPDVHMESPYIVRRGETLEDIANQFQVPWQLLANINGVDDPRRLPEGTELKVVRGPFSAVVDLDRQELTLFVARRYAGRFSIGVGNDPQPMEGEYTVREKQEQRTYYDRDGRAIEPGADENPYGPYWMGLGGRLAIHGAAAPARDGRRASSGSIILSPEDAQDLYAILSEHSPVEIRR